MYFILLSILPLTMIIIFAVLLKNADQRLEKQVKHLFVQSPKVSRKTFTHDTVANLPDPVQRYFKHVLSEGQPYINYVRLRHIGQFKTDLNGNWLPITGEEYFTTTYPGMIWKGNTKWFTAYDSLISGKGKLTVYLLSILRIVNGHGIKYSQGELLRWIGESVWFPTNLLPTENLQWSAIDSHTARLTYTCKKFSMHYLVTFNDVGEITQLETKRYMGDKNLETWIGKLSGYERYNRILVPTAIEAIWKLQNQDFPYARFKITALEYNIPQLY